MSKLCLLVEWYLCHHDLHFRHHEAHFWHHDAHFRHHDAHLWHHDAHFWHHDAHFWHNVAHFWHHDAPWRTFLAPWRTFLAQWHTFLAPGHTFSAPWRTFLAPWCTFLTPCSTLSAQCHVFSSRFIKHIPIYSFFFAISCHVFLFFLLFLFLNDFRDSVYPRFAWFFLNIKEFLAKFQLQLLLLVFFWCLAYQLYTYRQMYDLQDIFMFSNKKQLWPEDCCLYLPNCMKCVSWPKRS